METSCAPLVWLLRCAHGSPAGTVAKPTFESPTGSLIIS